MQPQQQQETVFYQDASPVFISSQRAVFFEQTFIMRNIVSVSMAKVKYYYLNEGFYLILGLALFFWGIKTPMTEPVLALGLVGSGFLLLLAGAILILRVKPSYALLIGSAGGQVEAVTSKDAQYITRLVNSVESALLYRGN